MSNTHSPVQPAQCTVCGDLANYVIGTSPTYGPQAAFTLKFGSGRYCLQHAKKRAAELLPAWQARQDASREAHSEAHAIWRAGYEATLERNATDEDLTEQRNVYSLRVGDVIHFTGGFRRSVQTVERVPHGVRVLLSNGVRTTFLPLEDVAVEVN